MGQIASLSFHSGLPNVMGLLPAGVQMQGCLFPKPVLALFTLPLTGGAFSSLLSDGSLLWVMRTVFMACLKYWGQETQSSSQ